MMSHEKAHDDSCIITSLKKRLAAQDCPETFSRRDVADLLFLHESLGNRLNRIVKISDGYQYELQHLTSELRQALANVKTLKGYIPICASCKKVRADDGYWRQIEQYIRENSDASLSHGLCPECASNYCRLASVSDEGEEIPAGLSIKVSADDLDNPVISHYLNIIGNKHFNNTPLRADLLRLLEKYILLQRRQLRIARISDNYQAEVKEIKEKFENEARIDHLTGLSNRRDMFRVMHAEIGRISRHGGTFSLIMFDFDDFKSINDMHGHEAGDLTLQHCATLLLDVLRREDTAARWGGEEFMLIQSGINRDGVLRTAERLRLLIEQSPLHYKGARIEPTISLGVALYRLGEPLNELLHRVDSSLYEAKRQGKNRVGPIV
jgi:diguanylate cyclase (GGDEF)-like protein